MRNLLQVVIASLSLAAACGAACSQESTVRIALAHSTANAAELIALRNGYFKEHGIKVAWETVKRSTDAIEKLAQGKYQVLAGGISAAYFKALEKNLPITIASDRVSSPVGHNLMLRPDLKHEVKTPKDLKGRVIATNADGSISSYAVGKILEKYGLTVEDVDLVPLSFARMPDAFASKAIDAGFLIPPFVYQFEDKKIALPFASVDRLVEPQPMTVAVIMINTDWAKKNPALVQNYFRAWLRGVRAYCQGYHGAPIRNEIVEALVKSGGEKRPELLHKYPWPARSPNGRVNAASLLDIQAWYVKNGLASAELPIERLVDTSFVEAAVEKLGPFELVNYESRLPGCR